MCAISFFFFCKQKTAYEMRISDWSSDVFSSDLAGFARRIACERRSSFTAYVYAAWSCGTCVAGSQAPLKLRLREKWSMQSTCSSTAMAFGRNEAIRRKTIERRRPRLMRSEEHTSELQSLMRISYAVFCLKKKTKAQ